MQFIFVVGFFDEVEAELRDRYPLQIESRSLNCVRLRRADGKAELATFIELFRKCLETPPTEILVLLATIAGEDWIEERIRLMVTGAGCAPPKVSPHARAIDFVLQEISAFGLPVPTEISMEFLRSKLGNAKVLCVRPDHATGFQETFSRQGFPDEAWGECFEELPILVAKNSNLNKMLAGKSNQYQCLLYAHKSLRHLDKNVERYEKVISRAVTSDVVADFKRWLLSKE